MSQIRVIYQYPVIEGQTPKDPEPNFPATDQHPDAERFFVWEDGSISPALVESASEKQVIDDKLAEYADADKLATEKAHQAEAARGQCVIGTVAVADMAHNLEVLKDQEADPEQIAAVEEVHTRARSELEELETQTAAKEQLARVAAGQAGLIGAHAMNGMQRLFLRRIVDPELRAEFIQATRKRRAEMMEKLQRPVMVVDAIGAPTMEEIDAFLPSKI